METENLRNETVSLLKKYYADNGILPGDKFNCINKEICKGFCGGMQCHIGHKFGQKTRVLVVSLDCGNGGAQEIDERTETIEDLKSAPKINLHMDGTIKCVADFFEFEKDKEKDCLPYYAMTNACKCTRQNSANQMDWKYFDRCAFLKKEEIKIINPEVVYFQGQRAIIGCEFKPIEGVPENLKDFLQYLMIDNKKYIAVKCIHPSARGRNFKRRKEFYEKTITLINKYIRENLL